MHADLFDTSRDLEWIYLLGCGGGRCYSTLMLAELHFDNNNNNNKKDTQLQQGPAI